MKCGSCRDINADSYKKITEENDIFEILKYLNPGRAYNNKYSYFCGSCINLATSKLSGVVSTISQQNARGFTNLNTSNSSNTTDSSKDEFDYMVMSKYVYSDTGTPIRISPIRKRGYSELNTSTRGKEKQKPCPKRFKKPLVPIQETYPKASVVEGPSSQQKSSISETSKPGDAEINTSVRRRDTPILKPCPKQFKKPTAPIEETVLEISVVEDPLSIQKHIEVILQNFDTDEETPGSLSPHIPDAVEPPSRNKRRLEYLSDSSSSEETANQQSPVLDVQNKQQSDPSVHPRSRPIIQMQNVSDTSDSSDIRISINRQATVQATIPIRRIQQESTLHGSIGSPSAPFQRSPRIRQDSSNIGQGIRQYFSTNEINVSNYSRSLAG